MVGIDILRKRKRFGFNYDIFDTKPIEEKLTKIESILLERKRKRKI